MRVTTKHFADRWSKEMGRAEISRRQSYWEAEAAVRELGEKFPRWLRTRSLRREILKDLRREADAYQRLRRQVAESNQAFKSALGLIAIIRRKIKQAASASRQEPGPANKVVSRFLADLTMQLERSSENLEKARSNFWRIQLRPYPLERDNSQEVWIALPLSEKEWGSALDFRYEGKVAEGIARTAKLPESDPNPIRTIALDRRFQLRVAAIMDQQFPDLSMETQARLVVLVYICFGLVRESAGVIRIQYNLQKLTVGSVYEKLKRQKRLTQK